MEFILDQLEKQMGLIYYSDYNLDGFGMNHLKIFEKNYPEINYRFMMITDSNCVFSSDSTRRIIFDSKEDLKIFEKWFKKYSKSYTDFTRQLFPRMNDQTFKYKYFVSIPNRSWSLHGGFQRYTLEEELIEILNFIYNANKNIVVVNDTLDTIDPSTMDRECILRFFFESETDAMAFKLRFS